MGLVLPQKLLDELRKYMGSEYAAFTAFFKPNYPPIIRPPVVSGLVTPIEPPRARSRWLPDGEGDRIRGNFRQAYLDIASPPSFSPSVFETAMKRYLEPHVPVARRDPEEADMSSSSAQSTLPYAIHKQVAPSVWNDLVKAFGYETGFSEDLTRDLHHAGLRLCETCWMPLPIEPPEKKARRTHDTEFEHKRYLVLGQRARAGWAPLGGGRISESARARGIVTEYEGAYNFNQYSGVKPMEFARIDEAEDFAEELNKSSPNGAVIHFGVAIAKIVHDAQVAVPWRVAVYQYATIKKFKPTTVRPDLTYML